MSATGKFNGPVVDGAPCRDAHSPTSIAPQTQSSLSSKYSPPDGSYHAICPVISSERLCASAAVEHNISHFLIAWVTTAVLVGPLNPSPFEAR